MHLQTNFVTEFKQV